MEKIYRIVVFGKSGCPKCKTLNSRLDKLLQEDEWQQFEKIYYNLETIEGLLTFSRMECINPNRIPAMVVLKNEGENEFRPLSNSAPEKQDNICKASRLYTFLGLQTDYTETGKGLITPNMLISILKQAVAA